MLNGLAKKRLSHFQLSNLQIIALGYLLMISAGAFLLWLPFSSKTGVSANFMNALFTSTSATCVTGLTVVDTDTTWSVFGQVVILALIQIGGLGFMTIATFLSIILRRKIGLKERQVMVQSINTTHIGGVLKLTKKIAIGTAIFEICGALLFSIRFIPRYGFWKGIYYSVFHAVSSFCNAGLDLMGEHGQFSSLSAYRNDILVNVTVMILCIVGGIGFLVWDDIYKNKFRFRKYQLHTKIVLSTSAILILGGAVLYYIVEIGNNAIGNSIPERMFNALFLSVCARSVGFSTCDMSKLTDMGKLISMLLMFIGGSPGSTAGGIKTTSVAVIVLFAFAQVSHKQTTTVFGRRLEDDTLKDAVAIVCVNLAIIGCGVLIINPIHHFSILDVIFEVTAALSTTGWSLGITSLLEPIPRAIIILLMYFGRVGSVSFALAFLEKKARPPVTAPVEKITVG